MSVQPSSDSRAGEHAARESTASAESTTTCCAPSCWDDGSRVKIEGVDVNDARVLCETHRQAYLGVST